ncbi:uncharacterized protein TNCV_1802481 [Trichonephila clavipes]|nr:uncharacterized protein TNCV_1802481 [Trichonephila clavipes]
MINAEKKERFLPDPGTIVLRQMDVNLFTGKPFRIQTCCSSQMLINSLREDTEYLLDLGVNGMVQSNRTLPVVWLGRVNRYPFPRIKCMKYRNLNQFINVNEQNIKKNGHLGFLLKEVETDQAIEEPTESMHMNQDSESKYQKSVRHEAFELIRNFKMLPKDLYDENYEALNLALRLVKKTQGRKS